MTLTVLGEHPLACDQQWQLKSRIGTIFLREPTLVTLPGVHATQRLAFVDHLNARRAAQGEPPLSAAEELAEWEQSVDLIMDADMILIRPDPERMDQAFVADELLQQLVSKRRIRFLNVTDAKVRQAIKQRGECWRISPLPQSAEEMQRMITGARVAIGEQPLYYYSVFTGTRYVTCQEFAQLANLPRDQLARQLQEITTYAGHRNRLHRPEVDFFGVDGGFGHRDLAAHDWLHTDGPQLQRWHAELAARFREVVPAALRTDELGNLEWRNRMFSALIGQQNQTVAEEILHGLSPEFFMQIRWLPGGRIEDGEFMFDPIFDEREQHPDDAELAGLCDDKARGFIFNFIREFGDIEYLNIGRVASSLSQRPVTGRRRGVYIAEVCLRDVPEPIVRIIRMQKWEIVDHLEEGKSLLDAIMESEEYTEYVLDRRLGCRQLGMQFPTLITTRRLYQPYRGERQEFEGQRIWFTYYERDYINGIATDKIAPSRYRLPEFSLRFARLLGQAAAPSIIVGKADANGESLFDDGDEVVIEDNRGLPGAIVASDHTGAFVNYTEPLAEAAENYARPVNRRLVLVPDPVAFAAAYLEAFTAQFCDIQEKYRTNKRGFNALFKHRRRDERGSFAYRWEKVLERLEATDAQELRAAIKKYLALLNSTK